MEQTRSAPFRLRQTRGCDIVHSSMHDPLTSYKTLEPLRPRLQTTQRRFHLTDGYKCFDQDTICISARDQLMKTKDGILRTSSGSVVYSDTHRKKVELDVRELARILAHEGIPGGGHAWTVKKLERVFRERAGRCGSWAHYEVPFREFLLAFPKTFQLFKGGECVRVLHANRPLVLDESEAALVRLAKARENGHIDTLMQVCGTGHKQAEELAQKFPNYDWYCESHATKHELKRHRIKAAFQQFDVQAKEEDEFESSLPDLSQHPAMKQQVQTLLVSSSGTFGEALGSDRTQR